MQKLTITYIKQLQEAASAHFGSFKLQLLKQSNENYTKKLFKTKDDNHNGNIYGIL
jgi:hypothetical protein